MKFAYSRVPNNWGDEINGGGLENSLKINKWGWNNWNASYFYKIGLIMVEIYEYISIVESYYQYCCSMLDCAIVSILKL